MSKTKKILLVLLIVFLVMQSIRPPRNSNSTIPAEDLVTYYNPPANVAGILKNSCYDCHSNNTRYPWYANIQPIGWILAGHVKDGKDELNFNEFTTYSRRRQLGKLNSIRNSIKDSSMPLKSYTWLHEDARLSKADKALILDWIQKTTDRLKAKD